MKRIFIVMQLACMCFVASAQQIVNDTLAYRQCFAENFGTRINLRKLMGLYQRLSTDYSHAERQNVKTWASPPGHIGWGQDCSGAGFLDVGKWSWQPGKSRLDSFLFPDSLDIPLSRNISYYDHKIKSKQEEKAALVAALRTFDSISVHKPIFYADIYSTFKGNYKKYVDHLYRRSILCNSNRMMLFRRKPKKEKLQKDPGVQFVIGLALYELWIKDVREGKVKDNATANH